MIKKLLLCSIFMVMSLTLLGCFSIKNVSVLTTDYTSVIGSDYRGAKKTLLVKVMSSVKEDEFIGTSFDTWNRPLLSIYLSENKVEVFIRELYKALKAANYNIVMMQDYENYPPEDRPNVGGYLKIDLIKFSLYAKQDVFYYPITTDIQFNTSLFSPEERKRLWEKQFVKQEVYKRAVAYRKQYEEAISSCLESIMIDFSKEVGAKEFRDLIVGFPEDSTFVEKDLSKQYESQIAIKLEEYKGKEQKKLESAQKRKEKQDSERKDLMKSRRSK